MGSLAAGETGIVQGDIRVWTMEEIKDEPESTEFEESDSASDRVIPASLRRRDIGGQMTDKKMVKADLLLAARLSENRSKDDMHARAKKLKHHYKEVEACDKIMGYGFVVILFLVTGFSWSSICVWNHFSGSSECNNNIYMLISFYL